MKNLLRRFYRVSKSPNYALLRNHTLTRHRRSKLLLRHRTTTAVPVGHLPVYVGDEMERFVVPAEHLNHPIFAELLNRSAQEYGYEGVLRISCHVIIFEKVLEALRLGSDDSAFDLLKNSSS